ncbi:MAG TPA: hypothetical protein VF499_12695 [Afipia sp.]
MIVYTVTEAVRDAIVAALNAHAEHPSLFGALGRITREDNPKVLAGFISIWAADADGKYRIARSDVGGALIWRAHAIAEIAAGRGRLADLADYKAVLGIDETQPAFDYVCHQMKRRCIRPCATADHDSWTAATEWVVRDGDVPDPRTRWVRDALYSRQAAYRSYAAAGLAMPGQDSQRPGATLLFVTPKPTHKLPPKPRLTAAEDDAIIAEFARWLRPSSARVPRAS